MDKEDLVVIADENGCLFVDGYDDCILGMFSRFGMVPLLAYDKEKMLKKMVKDGMTYEEALEFFDYNIIGAWMGETTPVFIEVVDKEIKPRKKKHAKIK